MTADPPVREDGACIVCGNERVTAAIRPLYRAAMRDDPFCSTECARSWWGSSIQRLPRQGRRGYVSMLRTTE